MTSLYFGAPSGGDDLASPLLGSQFQKTNVADSLLSKTAGTRTSASSEADHVEMSASVAGGGSTVRRMMGDDLDDKTCCSQLLRSIVAVLIAAGGIAASVLCFVYTPVDQLEFSIWVYIMGGTCILNAIVMIKNEKSFLITLPSRSPQSYSAPSSHMLHC